MKKHTPLMLGLLSFGIVSGAATAALTTNAFAAEDATTSTVAAADEQTLPVLTEEQQAMKALHESAEEALKAGDYATWSSTMTQINETRYQETKEAITEDNFAILQKIQVARESGDFETVRTLSQQIGMPLMGMNGKHRGGPGADHGPRHERASQLQNQAQN